MLTDVVLSGLTNLFALFGSKSGLEVPSSRQILMSYLRRHFGIRNYQQYLDLYDDLRALYDSSDDINKESIIEGICHGMENQLQRSEQSLMLLRLMEFCYKTPDTFHELQPAFRVVAKHFEVNQDIFKDFEDYVTGRESLHVINQHFEGLKGVIRTLWLPSLNLMLFTYLGQGKVLLNDVPVVRGIFQAWQQSGILKFRHSKPVYYSMVRRVYDLLETNDLSNVHATSRVEFCGRNVNFRFPNSDNGMHNLSFTLHSGRLIAIMGGSGTGKTTLLSLLNGSLVPQEGQITINGHDIQEPAAKALIGYVPQDDLLIEELTVYQNLYYTAQLCFSGMSEAELDSRVIQVLSQLDLLAAKDLKVGSAINKYISGGQRKRLNIALELIREPAVLFLDEPTSGLSSTDTEKVILLLKEQTLKGRLIVVNIHQPSSDVYKMFDRLWLLDKGGYPVFDGNPIEAVTYFKGIANYADSDTSTCPTCGNVNPEVVLNIIDEKSLDEKGMLTDRRKVTPKEWHDLYLKNRPEQVEVPVYDIPVTSQKQPGGFGQFYIQLKRIFATKVTNFQYLLITLLVSPLLAFICGLLTHYAPESGYTVLENKNFVTFLFMAVVASIFIGMVGAAEEIIKDRALLQREKFLHLSYGSYMSSKICFMAIVSLVQTFLFTLVGQMVIGFHDLFFVWWMILFAASFLASLTGLWLSQTLTSVVSIYITIPLLLIPQILLCGLVVDFNDLSSNSTTGNVPVIGNLIPSRWAFEAIAVTTYTDNAYEKPFFEYDRQKYENEYYRLAFVYELESQLETWQDEIVKGKEVKPVHEKVLQTELPELYKFVEGAKPFVGNVSDYAHVKQYLHECDSMLTRVGNEITLEADRFLRKRRDEVGGRDAFLQMKSQYFNTKLEEVVRNIGSKHMIEVVDGHLVPRVAYVYLTPRSINGNAPFYSPVKCLGNYEITTLWFNLLIQALMALAMALLLYSNIFNRIKLLKK